MRLISVVFALLAFPVYAQTAEPSRQVLLEEISAAITQHLQSPEIGTAIEERLSNRVSFLLNDALKGRAPTREQRDEAQNRAMRLLASRYGSPESVQSVISEVLDHNLNDAELQQLRTFVQSNAGSKTLPILTGLSDVMFEYAVDVDSEDMARMIDEVAGNSRAHERLVKRTMADMRTLATASEAYAADTERYPAARDIDELGAMISPTYIRQVPRLDAWGGQFAYVTSADAQQYRFISGGADQKIDFASRIMPGHVDGEPKATLTDDPNADIIFENGSFLQFPRFMAPEFQGTTDEPYDRE